MRPSGPGAPRPGLAAALPARAPGRHPHPRARTQGPRAGAALRGAVACASGGGQGRALCGTAERSRERRGWAMACSAVARQRPLWRVVGWRGKGGNGEQTEGWIRLGKGAVEAVAGAPEKPG